MPENTSKRAVSFEDFAEASKLIATKEELKKATENLGGGVEYATTEEVLALFTEASAENGTGSQE